MKCPICSDKKEKMKLELSESGFDYGYSCEFCKDKKDLDWIENIIGVTPIKDDRLELKCQI